MLVLIACEYSGRVRDAFTKHGHNAVSCDLLPSETPGYHYQGNVMDILGCGWDLMIAHPPCTHLAVSGAAHFWRKENEQLDALQFVWELMEAPIPKICIENPVSVISTKIRKPDQVIQPWQFGHAETKKTCLWLKDLPKLVPTYIVEPDFMRKPDGSYYTDNKGKRYSKTHFMSFGKNNELRSKMRSLTYQGIADAMGEQWG